MKTEILKDNLPTDWGVVDLGDLLERITNGLTCEQEMEPPGIPVTRIETISNGVVDFERVRYVLDLDEAKKARFLLQRGDILFSHINSDLHLGKTAVVTNDKPLLHGMNLLLLRTKKEQLDPYYLHYLLNFYRRSGTFMAIAQHAVNQSSLNQKKINSLKVPLAPLDQQQHIIAEIEKQFSRLDEAVANLKRVKANLKRYKAAVLKAAVEGRLVETEAEIVRREGRSYETGAQLLQRILETRRSQWKGKGKYKEPAAPDTTGLPELPDGWVWATVEQITTEMMNGYGKRSQMAGKPRIVLRLADIVDGEISFAEVRRINCTEDELRKYVLSKGDLLILRVNGSPDLVGRFVIVHKTPEPALFCDHFIRARCTTSDLAAWLRAYGDVERFRRYVDLNKVSSAGQNTINQGALCPFAFPLPPVEEQHRIAAEIDRRLSLIREVEAQVDANFRRAERLRQSILARAFSGLLQQQICVKEYAESATRR